jgi:hypothetical protein
MRAPERNLDAAGHPNRPIGAVQDRSPLKPAICGAAMAPPRIRFQLNKSSEISVLSGYDAILT